MIKLLKNSLKIHIKSLSIQVKLIRNDGIQETVDEKKLSLFIKDKINYEK